MGHDVFVLFNTKLAIDSIAILTRVRRVGQDDEAIVRVFFALTHEIDIVDELTSSLRVGRSETGRIYTPRHG